MRGTSQDLSHSHKAHGGYEEPQAVSKMVDGRKSVREKFVRSDFFSAKAEKSLVPKRWPNLPKVGNSAERWLDFGTPDRSNPHRDSGTNAQCAVAFSHVNLLRRKRD